MGMLSVYGLAKDLLKFLELLFTPLLKRSFVDIKLQLSFVVRVGRYLRRYLFDCEFALVFFGI